MEPYRISATDLAADPPFVGSGRGTPSRWTLLPLWGGLALIAGAVAVFLWAREYALALPAPVDPDDWLVSDPTLSAADFALLLLWQLGVALLAWGWLLRHGASTLLWIASTGLSLGALALVAAIAFVEADGVFSLIGFFILPGAGILMLCAGVVSTIALLVLPKRGRAGEHGFVRAGMP